MTTFLTLLRGINVSGHRKVSMAELREVAAGLGLDDVRTYIQSGNLVFTRKGKAVALEAALEQAVADHFGFHVDLVVRTAGQWSSYLEGNPFATAAANEPNRVLLALSKWPPQRDAGVRLQERANAGERVAVVGESLWFHFPEGVGKSKLTPALLDRMVGSPVTARNWRTAQHLAAMAAD